MEQILEILKYILPSIVVFLTAYFILDIFAKNQIKRRQLEYQTKSQSHTLPLRLQAYERLSLLIERISPTSLIPRVKSQGMSAKEMQLAMLANIRQEYEHNLSQQIYVSSTLWNLITNLKEEIIKMIVSLGAALPEDATANDLSRNIFQAMLNSKDGFPTAIVQDVLKEEVKELY